MVDASHEDDTADDESQSRLVCKTSSASSAAAAGHRLADSPSCMLLSPTGSFSVVLGSLEKPGATMKQRITDELLRLTRMAGPLFVQNLLAYSTTLIAVAFVGHLNNPELLSSAVLANSLYNVSGYSLLAGLASGMESLCGQAYGGRSFKTLGLVLQRALIINWLTCIPITLLWLHSEQILLLLGQQPKVAAGAAMYLRFITPTLYMGALVECLKRYLLAQRVVVPGMIVTAATCVLSPVYNWLFIFRFHWGLAGAAIAFACSQATSCLFVVLYTIWRDASMAAAGHEEATWPRPSWMIFSGWGTYLSYGLPATVQLCTEWWMYEVVIFMAGAAHNAEVGQGVMGLLFQISACAYMSALAYGSSVNTRVGNELGAGNGKGARLAVYTCVVVVALVQSALAIACKLADRFVVGFLTNNKEVEELTLTVMPLLLPTFVGDALNCVCQGVLRGAGRPGIGAVLNSVGYWVVGVPMAAYFGLYLGWTVKGFWLGLMLTSFMMDVVQLLVIAHFDWDKEVERAALLMAQHHDEMADGKAAALHAAVSDTGRRTSLDKARQWQQHEEEQEDQEEHGAPGDTAPLLDSRRGPVSEPLKGPAWRQQQQAGRLLGQQQLPSRLSQASASLAEQQQQQIGAEGAAGQALQSSSDRRHWWQWPIGRRQQQTEAQFVEGVQSRGPQLQHQGSLYRSLLQSRPSLSRADSSVPAEQSS